MLQSVTEMEKANRGWDEESHGGYMISTEEIEFDKKKFEYYNTKFLLNCNLLY